MLRSSPVVGRTLRGTGLASTSLNACIRTSWGFAGRIQSRRCSRGTRRLRTSGRTVFEDRTNQAPTCSRFGRRGTPSSGPPRPRRRRRPARRSASSAGTPRSTRGPGHDRPRRADAAEQSGGGTGGARDRAGHAWPGARHDHRPADRGALLPRGAPAHLQRDARGVRPREAIDFVTLREALTTTGDLEEVGGPAYITALVDGVPASTNVAYYARIVREKATGGTSSMSRTAS